MSHTVSSSERHIFPSRLYLNMVFITFQSLNYSYYLAFNRRESEFFSGPQMFISSCWCLPNDTLEKTGTGTEQQST